WDKMSPREQGAFCGVCAKTVVDFTTLSDEQVGNYFVENRGKKTCGRFRNEQLTTDADLLPKILSGNIPLWKKFLAAVVILFGTLLTGCRENVTGKIDASQERHVTTGVILTDIKVIPDTVQLPPLPPKIETGVCTVTQGDVAPIVFEERPTMGIVEMPIPEIMQQEPVIKKDTLSRECDDLKKDSLIYLEPK
ncbi:MAG TPA: hypothetical protein VGO58_14800, partial [Chitinophagaceae bacterium]|nr:hypothetical protein [Chitinophagaceae bacterium]